jgi:RND family efflux transporter MFP subunit
MKFTRKSFAIYGLILMIALAIGWLVVQKFDKADLTKRTAMFDTVEARRMDLSDKVNVTGNVVLEKNAVIYPPYKATVKKILKKPGDAVQKGDLLLVLQIDDPDLVNYSAGWKSSLDQARMNLTIAQKALEREKILFQAQGATIDEVESAQSKVLQYQAQVDEYRLKLESLTKNGVDNNNNILIRAPFDADISWINVKLEESVTTSTELLTLCGDSAIRVEVHVDQGDIGQMKAGLKALISANDQNRTIIPGVVTSFGSTGTTSSGVVTFPVIIKPSESASLGNLLKSGMTVDVTIMVNSRLNALVIPARAVIEEDGQTMVKVLRSGEYVLQKVRLGLKNSNWVEVLSGLSEGDRVTIPKIEFSNPKGTSGSNKTQVGSPPMGPPPM